MPCVAQCPPSSGTLFALLTAIQVEFPRPVAVPVPVSVPVPSIFNCAIINVGTDWEICRWLSHYTHPEIGTQNKDNDEAMLKLSAVSVFFSLVFEEFQALQMFDDEMCIEMKLIYDKYDK